MAFRPDIFWRSARGHCPDCNQDINPPGVALWKKLFNTPMQCTGCGMTLRRKEGFFLGSIVWNYGLISFGVLPILLLCLNRNWISTDHAIQIAVIAALVLPFLIHGFAWRLWIGTYYAFLPDQLPSSGRRLDD